MTNEKLHSTLCAAVLSLCLGLGAVSSMATALELPVKMGALVILCILLAAVIAGLSCLRWGSLISLGLGCIMLLNPDLWLELRTVAAAVVMRLHLGYGVPMPEFLQGDQSPQVLSALCMVAGLIMVDTAWAVQKQKTALPAVALSLVPLACCIIVVDTVPRELCLLLWGFGLLLLLMTQKTRHENIRRANQLTGLLAIPTALFLILLLFAVPRNAPEQWSIAQWPEKILSQFTDPSVSGPNLPGPQAPTEVNLAALPKRQQRQIPIMEVTADFSGSLYLRGRDYDLYTGTQWCASPNRTEELYGFDSRYHQKDGAVTIETRQPRSLYYLPAITLETQRLIGGEAQNPDMEQTYRFDHCSLLGDWKNGWADTQFSAVNPRYLELPHDTFQGVWTYISGRQELLDGLSTDLSAPEAAELIGQHLRHHVPYSLSTPNMPVGETDLALWFLNDASTGYCVHYATAAVALLRASGIPARYVEGYALNVQKEHTATVRELHAHAWAEYYVNDVGWLVLDATPGGDTAPEEPTTQPTETQSATTTAPTQSTAPGTEPEEAGKTPDAPKKEPPAWLKSALLTLVWAAAALGILGGQYRLRRRLFRRSIFRGSYNKRALHIHKRLCLLSKWTKEPVPAELTQLAQKARFSQHTLTPSELARLQGYLKLAESAVSLLPLYKRLPAKWLFARY